MFYATEDHHEFGRPAEVRPAAFIQYDVMEGGSYEGGVADGRYYGWGRHTDTLGQVTEGQWTHGQLNR
jgi:hypothetical protein